MAGSSSSNSKENMDLFVDDFYFSALFDHEGEIFPVSDELYAEELQLQEALISNNIALRLSSKIKHERSEIFEQVNHHHLKRVKIETGESSQTQYSFCGECNVAWHAGMDCKEFQRHGVGGERDHQKEDLMMKELAEKMKWRRCPNCQFFVEKLDGCLHISCRCGFEFCYGCGTEWSSTHQCPQI